MEKVKIFSRVTCVIQYDYQAFETMDFKEMRIPPGISWWEKEKALLQNEMLQFLQVGSSYRLRLNPKQWRLRGGRTDAQL